MNWWSIEQYCGEIEVDSCYDQIYGCGGAIYSGRVHHNQ